MASSVSIWRSSGFCRPRLQKQSQNQCVHDLLPIISFDILRMFFLFMLRPRYILYMQWHMHLTNGGYLDYKKNPTTPNMGPMQGWKWHRFWDLWCISVVLTLIYLPHFEDFQCWKYQSGFNNIYDGWRKIVNQAIPYIIAKCVSILI